MISEHDFRAWLLEQGKSTLTARSYLSALRGFSAWLLVERNLRPFSGRVNQRTVKDYLLWMALEGKRPSTINLHLAAIRLFYELAIQQAIIQESPAAGVPIRAPDTLSPNQAPILTLEDIDTLLQRARSQNGGSAIATRNAAILATMLSTGLQVGAICSLDSEHFEADHLRLPNGKAKRTRVPLNQEAIQSLNDWLSVRSELENNETSAAQALFISKAGERLTTRSVQKILAQFGKQVDLDLARNLSARIIRRTYMAHKHEITPIHTGRVL